MASFRSDVPMSLSRRLLSLPQELEGPSLPPQVSGSRCGTVVLCVAHILESAVSSRPLPTLPLVRVRWWGEAQPQSLFRPSILSNEKAAHVADAPPSTRAIAMKYPVVVPPFQLVEYFTDMRNLTLEVIDRSSKVKFGECKLTLDVQSGNSVMTAEEKLVALRREDVLCEIKPCEGEEGDVLGYLTVCFDVRWSELEEDCNDDAVLSSSADSLPSKREWTEFQVEKEDLSTLDVESVVSVEKNVRVDFKDVKKEEIVVDRMLSDESQRIRRLLEKGKALKQSMERAVKDKEGEFVQEREGTEDIYGNRVMKEVRQALLLDSDKIFTPPIFGEDSKLIELPSEDIFQHNLPDLSALDKSRMKIKNQLNSAARANEISEFILPDQVNTLSLTYDSLELERSFVENQLRRLRDSSSVSSRFSPIEICVSHSDVASLLHQHSGEDVPQVHAFSVTTSLRKRQWHLECLSTILLTRPSSTVNVSTRRDTYSKTVKRNSIKQLRFRVRCENQSDARRNKRRHEQHLYPRLTKSCVLEGTVDALTLFSVAKEAKKTWTTTVELFVVENDTRRHGTKHNSSTRDGLRQHEVPRSKKATAVGKLHVRFAFYDMSVCSQSSESGSAAENEQGCESVLSSITLSPDILSEYQSRQPARHEHQPQAEKRELHLAAQYDMEDAKWRLRGSELLHFGVMFEDVKVSGSINEDFQSTLGTGISRSIATESLDKASISLHYAVPSQFTTQSSTAIKFERTIRRKLRTSHWFNSGPILQAEFSGHIHVFQLLLGEDSSKYFRGCQLIIEVWLHASKNSDRTLLGLSKLPLKKFSDMLRLEGSDLHDFRTKSLPYVGVDGRFSIDNPFNGDNAGHLRARVCMGTAEQILVFATTIRSLVKFQGVVRGVLFRKRFYAISPASLVSSSRELGADTIGSEKESYETFIVGYRHEGALAISTDKLLQWTQVSKEPNLEAIEAKSNVGGYDSAVSSLVAEHRLDPENCSVGNTVPCSVASTTETLFIGTVSDADDLKAEETQCEFESELGQGIGFDDETSLRHEESSTELSSAKFDKGSNSVASNLEGVEQSKTHNPCVNVSSDASELDRVETPREIESEADEGFGSEDGTWRRRVSDEFSREASPTESGAEGFGGVASSSEAVDEQLEPRLEIENLSVAETVPACADSTTQTSSVDVGSDASETGPVEAPPELESAASEYFGSEDGTERGSVSDEFSVETSPTKSDAKRSDGVASSSEAVDEQLEPRLEIENFSVAETVPACADSTTQTSSVDVGSDASETDPVEAPPELESAASEYFGSEDGTERGSVSDEFSVETSPTKSDAKRSDGVASSSEAVDEQLEPRLEIENFSVAETVPACADSTTQTSSVDVGSDTSETDPVEAPPELESAASEYFGSEDGTERGSVSDEFSVETSPTKSDAKRSDGVASSSEAVDEQLERRLEIENFSVAETVPACVDSTTQTSSVDAGSNANEQFVSDPTPTGDVATGAFGNVAVNTDGVESQLGGEANCFVKLPVECADKAIQVDCTELGFLLKTATASPNNNIESKLNDDIVGKSSGHSDAEMVELSCEVGSADDVVVDVENTDVSFSSLVSSVQRTTLEQNRCRGDIQRHNLICSEPSAPLSEKMEMMYEILRELRDSYFAKPSSEPIGFIDTSEGTKEEKKQKVITDVNDAHCTCLISNHLDDPTPPPSILPEAKTDPSSPHPSSLTTDESGMRDLLPPSVKSPKAVMDNTQNTTSKMTFVDRHPQDKWAQFGNTMSTALLRESLYHNEERKKLQELKAGRLSSSDVVMTIKRNLNSCHHAVRKEEHSSVRSLFPHDSETERIARIMQGNMNYWMKEDSSSSSDEVGDDDDTTDDDCYF